MNVRELHARLGQLIEEGEGEFMVILSSDEEGNDFHEAHDVENARVYEGKWRYEPVYDWDTDEVVTEIPEGGDGSIHYVKAVTIWP